MWFSAEKCCYYMVNTRNSFHNQLSQESQAATSKVQTTDSTPEAMWGCSEDNGKGQPPRGPEVHPLDKRMSLPIQDLQQCQPGL